MENDAYLYEQALGSLMLANAAIEIREDRIMTLTLALKSVLRWTDRHDLPADHRCDAIHSVARTALEG